MKKYMIWIAVLTLTLSLASCGTFSSQKVDQGVTAEEGSSVTTDNQTRQIANQVQGSTVEGAVDKVINTTNTGISTVWFIIGALLFGMIIPRPFFIRWIFP